MARVELNFSVHSAHRLGPQPLIGMQGVGGTVAAQLDAS
jgi:hypothetical protein